MIIQQTASIKIQHHGIRNGASLLKLSAAIIRKYGAINKISKKLQVRSTQCIDEREEEGSGVGVRTASRSDIDNGIRKASSFCRSCVRIAAWEACSTADMKASLVTKASTRKPAMWRSNSFKRSYIL